MDLREAAQQALEALEISARFVYADNKPQCNDAIDALRAALAEDAMQRLTDVQQEMDCYGDGNVYRGQRSSDSKTQTLTINGMPAVEGPLSKAHRTCQESRQVEPVAFMHKNFERRIREVLTEADFGGDKLAFLKYCMSDGNLLPLYTAPPMSEPLSFAGVKITEVRLPKNMAMRFDGDVLVIERAHGIGGDK